MNPLIKKQIIQRDNFSCAKCGFSDKTGEGLKIFPLFLKNPETENKDDFVTFCSICYKHAPENPKKLREYLSEKIDGKLLDTFRKPENGISKKTKIGMNSSFSKGNHLSKAPRGYKFFDKKLVPDENFESIRGIFKEFLNTNISLTQLAKRNNLTTTGLIKLIQNRTYLGKVKLSGKEIQGSHQPLISLELFQKVQNKLKKIKN
jgi:hypothetical protein